MRLLQIQREQQELGATPCTATCTCLMVPGATPGEPVKHREYLQAFTQDATEHTPLDGVDLLYYSEVAARRLNGAMH